MAPKPDISAGEPLQLAPPRLKLAEYVRGHFRVEPEAGTPIEAVLDPAYLGHVAGRLGPGARLEILPECMTYYAEALVVDATPLSARVQLTLGPVPLAAGEQVLASDVFDARWISPAVRFGVTRKSDGAVMAKNFETKADAERWIAQRVGMKVVSVTPDPSPSQPIAKRGKAVDRGPEA